MRVGWDFSISTANKVFLGLVAFELLFVAVASVDVALGSPSWIIKQLFDLDGDANIPAWFSSVQLFVIGLIFLLISRMSGRDNAPSPASLILFGLGFIFLSADESASIHERMSVTLRNATVVPRFRDGHGVWISIYALIGVALLLLNYRAFAAMWHRHRRAGTFLAGGVALLVVGGVGLEIVSYEFLRDGSTPLLYSLEVVAEEFLEMFGASLALYGAMLLLLTHARADNLARAENLTRADA
jgi:hypothetical protein